MRSSPPRVRRCYGAFQYGCVLCALGSARPHVFTRPRKAAKPKRAGGRGKGG